MIKASIFIYIYNIYSVYYYLKFRFRFLLDSWLVPFPLLKNKIIKSFFLFKLDDSLLNIKII